MLIVYMYKCSRFVSFSCSLVSGEVRGAGDIYLANISYSSLKLKFDLGGRGFIAILCKVWRCCMRVCVCLYIIFIFFVSMLVWISSDYISSFLCLFGSVQISKIAAIKSEVGLSQFCNYLACESSFASFYKGGIFFAKFGVNFTSALFKVFTVEHSCPT